MKTSERESAVIQIFSKHVFQTILNQIFFVWAYWAAIFIVFKILDKILFHTFMGVNNELNELLSATLPSVWITLAIGLTPYIVGAIWCRHNQFFLKATRNSELIKIMFAHLLIQSVLIFISGFLPPSEG